MKPLVNLNKQNRIQFSENPLVMFVMNYSTQAERLAVYEKYQQENRIHIAPEMFMGREGVDFFELWIAGECCGILAVNFVSKIKAKSWPYAWIHPEAVFILSEQCGIGYGRVLSQYAADYYIEQMLIQLSKAKPTELEVTVQADIISREGASFVNGFYRNIVDSHFSGAADVLDIAIDFGTDFDLREPDPK